MHLFSINWHMTVFHNHAKKGMFSVYSDQIFCINSKNRISRKRARKCMFDYKSHIEAMKQSHISQWKGPMIRICHTSHIPRVPREKDQWSGFVTYFTYLVKRTNVTFMTFVRNLVCLVSPTLNSYWQLLMEKMISFVTYEVSFGLRS